MLRYDGNTSDILMDLNNNFIAEDVHNPTQERKSRDLAGTGAAPVER